VHRKCVVLLLLLRAMPALADQVILKNADRLTGSITKSDGKVLVIKTDYAGDVTVKFDAIQSITSSGDLNVSLAGKTVLGPVTTSGDDVVVATRTAGPVEAPKASVTMLRSPAEQAAYEKSLHPGLLEGWNGGLNLGFALTRGNSETKNLNIAFNATRKGFHDKLTLYTNSIYAANDLPTASPHTTANAIGGGARYDHDFAPRVFGFVNGDFYHDALQHLDRIRIRQVRDQHPDQPVAAAFQPARHLVRPVIELGDRLFYAFAQFSRQHARLAVQITRNAGLAGTGFAGDVGDGRAPVIRKIVSCHVLVRHPIKTKRATARFVDAASFASARSALQDFRIHHVVGECAI